MDYRIQAQEHQEIIQIQLNGCWDQGTQVPIITDLAEHLQGLSRGRVLLDVRGLDVNSTLGRDYYLATVVRDSWDGGAAVFAVLEDDAAPQGTPYFTDILTRAGLRVRGFRSVDEATAWLVRAGPAILGREENGS